jgi:hypothetical protein
MNVTVGPFTYTIRWDQNAALELEDDSGRCLVERGELWIHGALSESQNRETVTHELLHALLSLTGLDVDFGEKRSEDLARRLAPALLDTLQRNPLLVSYLEIT